MDVRQLLAIARKWALLLVTGVVLAGGVALIASSFQAKTYEARATLIVGQSLTAASPDYTSLLASQQLSSTYAVIATTRPQLQAVITTLGLDTTPDRLLTRVSAGTTAGSTLIELSAQDSDPARAAAIANELASQLVATTSSVQGRRQDLQAAIDADLVATQDQILQAQERVAVLVAKTARTGADDTELADLRGGLLTLRSTYATLLGYSAAGATNLLSVVEPAVPPADPIAPRILLNVLLGGMLGLLDAAGIALLAQYLKQSVGSAADVERLTGASVLASVGVMKGAEVKGESHQLAALLHPRSPISEAYRTLRANLEFAAVDSGLHSLLVTSALPTEGKTVTAINLAIVFAQAGRRVLLVDADLRRPTLHAALGLRNDIGLTNLLVVGNVAPESLAQPTAQRNLAVLACGPQPPNPAELLSSQRMRALLQRMEVAYDLVILDTAPLGAFADAAVLASIASDTLLVVDAGHSKRRSVREAQETLGRAGANVLGILFNRVPGASAELAAKYGGYFQQTLASQPTAVTEATPPPSDPMTIPTTAGDSRSVPARRPPWIGMSETAPAGPQAATPTAAAERDDVNGVGEPGSASLGMADAERSRDATTGPTGAQAGADPVTFRRRPPTKAS